MVDFGNRLARLGGCNRYGFFRRGEEALRTETRLDLVNGHILLKSDYKCSEYRIQSTLGHHSYLALVFYEAMQCLLQLMSVTS